MFKHPFARIVVMIGAAALAAGMAHAHGSGIGAAGDATKVDRVIEIAMDEMSYDPERVTVAPGETIRFVVTNVGSVVHEFNLGTPQTWQGHQDEMAAMMRAGMMSADRIHHDKMREAGMMHDDPNSVLLEPGESGEIVWTFDGDADNPGFACNVPGHLQAGMEGRVVIRR
ncbi:copper-binding protein [Rhodobacteraceae bacterium WD3A24]|nr:copper-binding protein [Rhodobacteraceae bacterium WD3A24]